MEIPLPMRLVVESPLIREEGAFIEVVPMFPRG
jgi:hypothetical protein